MSLKSLMPLIAGPAALMDRARPQDAPSADTSGAAAPPQREIKRSRGSSRRSQEAEPVSIIARGIRVEGEMTGSGVIRIEGTVAGMVRAEHRVHVAEGGTVEGDIYAREVILGGEVTGSIVADGRVEATAAAVIHGDITTPNLAVLEGATVCGSVHMVKQTGAGEAH